MKIKLQYLNPDFPQHGFLHLELVHRFIFTGPNRVIGTYNKGVMGYIELLRCQMKRAWFSDADALQDFNEVSFDRTHGIVTITIGDSKKGWIETNESLGAIQPIPFVSMPNVPASLER